MDVLLWVLFGAIAAWIAAIFIGTHTLHRIVGSIVLGVVSAVVAGATMQTLSGYSGNGVNYYSLLLATACSLFIVAICTHKKA